jgi:hypothetical protein
MEGLHIVRVESKGLQTDLFFWRSNGTVADRGEYLRIETPSNPGYYWGNLLLFERAPREGDCERWQTLFAEEFRDRPEVRHKLFGWQMEGDELGAVRAFLDAGFELETNVVLLSDDLRPPPHFNEEIEVKTIETEDEWRAVIECQVGCRPPRFSVEAYTAHIERRFRDHRRMITEGRGEWYGAFLGERLVADLGLFHDGETGRFQYVETDPGFRRRGICGTLVYRVGRVGLARGLKTLVMVADAEYHAARIYESVGFEPREKYSFCCLYPPEHRTTKGPPH